MCGRDMHMSASSNLEPTLLTPQNLGSRFGVIGETTIFVFWLAP